MDAKEAFPRTTVSLVETNWAQKNLILANLDDFGTEHTNKATRRYGHIGKCRSRMEETVKLSIRERYTVDT